MKYEGETEILQESPQEAPHARPPCLAGTACASNWPVASVCTEGMGFLMKLNLGAWYLETTPLRSDSMVQGREAFPPVSLFSFLATLNPDPFPPA